MIASCEGLLGCPTDFPRPPVITDEQPLRVCWHSLSLYPLVKSLPVHNRKKGGERPLSTQLYSHTPRPSHVNMITRVQAAKNSRGKASNMEMKIAPWTKPTPKSQNLGCCTTGIDVNQSGFLACPRRFIGYDLVNMEREPRK